MANKGAAQQRSISALFYTPRLPVTIGVLLAVLVILLTLAHALLPPIYRPTVAIFGAGLAAAGTIASAFYIGRTLRIHLQHQARSRQNITFHYMERWNDPAMFHSRHVCRELIDTLGPQGPEKVRDDLDKNLEKRTNVGHVLNFLEELAISISLERVDEELAKRAFAGLVINVYQFMKPWIEEQRRARRRPQLWSEVEWLYKRWGPGEKA